MASGSCSPRSEAYSPGRPTRISPDSITVPDDENDTTDAATGNGASSSSDTPLPLAQSSVSPAPAPGPAPSPLNFGRDKGKAPASASFRLKSPSFKRSPASVHPEQGPAPEYSTKEARLAKFKERHGENASLYADHAERIRKQLRALDRDKRYVLRPGRSKGLVMWDAVSTLALIYTAILTPFEAAFVSPALGLASWSDPWFIINRLLDVVFFVDMILQVSTAARTHLTLSVSSL